MAVQREFVAIARRVVWCTMATVDRRARPRSRVVHPVWELEGADLVGWVVTRPTPLKVAHLAAHPHVSCSYWDPAHDVAIAECAARWAPEARERVWRLCRSVPPPLGFDPDALRSGELEPTVLRLDPWRLSVAPVGRLAAGRPPLTWSAEPPARAAGTRGAGTPGAGTPGAVVGAYLKAAQGGDWETAFGFFAEDVVIRVPGRSRLAGEHRGRTAAIAFIEAAREVVRGQVTVDLVDRLESGERVALLLHERFAAEDGDVEIRRANVYRVVDGAIAEIWIFEADQDEVDALFAG